MQIHRLTGIVFMLLKNERSTAKELAERFEVSNRTIYRDIEILSGAGIPIYTDKGNGGGIEIASHYKLSNAILSEEEKRNIITSLKAFNASVNEEKYSSLLEKLSGVFKTSNNFIEVDFSDWQNDDRIQRIFDTLRICIEKKCLAQVEYCNANGDINLRDLEPLKLLFKHKNWYLYAYCRKKSENRLFKLARIRAIKRLDARFERTCEEREIAKNLHWNSDSLEISFTINKKFKGRIFEEFSSTNFVIDESGDYFIKAKMPIDEWVVGYFLSFGEYVKINEPIWLKEKIKEIHKKASKL